MIVKYIKYYSLSLPLNPYQREILKNSWQKLNRYRILYRLKKLQNLFRRSPLIALSKNEVVSSQLSSDVIFLQKTKSKKIFCLVGFYDYNQNHILKFFPLDTIVLIPTQLSEAEIKKLVAPFSKVKFYVEKGEVFSIQDEDISYVEESFSSKIFNLKTRSLYSFEHPLESSFAKGLIDFDDRQEKEVLYAAKKAINFCKNIHFLNFIEQVELDLTLVNSDRLLLLADNNDAENIQKLIQYAQREYPSKKLLANFEAEGVTFIRQIDRSLNYVLKYIDTIITDESYYALGGILNDKHVIVLGQPFYAGWGLTTDKNPDIQFHKSINKEIFFAYIFFKKPIFPAHIDDPVIGFLTDFIFAVKYKRSEYEVSNRKEKESNIMVDEIEEEPNLDEDIGDGDFVGESKVASELERELREALFLEEKNDQKNNRIVLDQMMVKLFDPKFGKIFNQTFKHYLAFLNRKKPYLSIYFENTFRQIEKNVVIKKWHVIPLINKINNLFVKERFHHEVLKMSYDQVANGGFTFNLFFKIARIAYLSLDFKSALNVLRLYDWHFKTINHKTNHLIFTTYSSLAKDHSDALGNFIKTSFQTPRLLPRFFEDSVADITYFFGDIPLREVMINILENYQYASNLVTAQVLIELNQLRTVELILVKFTPDKLEREAYGATLAKFYRLQKRFDEAEYVLNTLLHLNRNSTNLVLEAVNLAMDMGDYEKGKQIIQQARMRGIKLSPSLVRKNEKGRNDIREIFLSHRTLTSTKTLKKYIPHKLFSNLIDFEKMKSSKYKVVLAYFGPGDEIRFASTYPKIAKFCQNDQIIFACDPRLFELFKRSFPDLEFVPVLRVRNLTWAKDISNFKSLPGVDLFRHLDNRGWELVQDSSAVILQLDALYDVIESYDDFDGTPYLLPDKNRVSIISKRLEGFKGKKLVGLCWRSSLNTPSRMGGYLKVEDLEPLFKLEDVVFVNLQYGECFYDLAEIDRKFPQKLIHLDDIDLFDDLNQTADLISCLDLVIAPATTIAELSGGLGVKTILFSMSSQSKWRLFPDSQDDVWHKSVTNIYDPDRKNLVNKLVNTLQSYI